MRWSEAVTVEFVKMYLKHECLWNPNHPGYKIKYQREKAYFDICSEFKTSTMKTLTVPEVKMKIKNLRTTYVQQVQKILQKSGPNSIYEPSLVWFNEMDRCLKHIRTNRHLYSLSTQETPGVDSSCQIWVDQGTHQDNEEMNPDPLSNPEDDDFESSKMEESTPIKKERLSQPSKKKKKYKHRNLNQIQDYPKNANFEATKEDEFDIYGKYIASQLRKMDLHKALRLQLEIQSLVSEARLSDITSN
ncbi:uncharacterized protein LOC116771480 [Danaus plexippus]|uniref:uncharacterized protein LOC116771480 n=1 Tax=Danaus plexippus TaxID=13037 RepID=UPI002AB0657C|nr:uncharacterized protein LOC116771480 [Danaus plexippus]